MQVNYQTESDIKPNKVLIENILNGKCDIVFNDDIKESEESVIDEHGETSKRIKYTFNSYRIQTNYRESLETELKNDNNIEIWLSKLRKDYYNQKAQEVRKKRNELLKETDAEMCLDRMGLKIPEGSTFSSWITFFKDLGKAISGDMAKYRQELRDITKQAGFPYNVVFPVNPSTKEESEEQ